MQLELTKPFIPEYVIIKENKKLLNPNIVLPPILAASVLVGVSNGTNVFAQAPNIANAIKTQALTEIAESSFVGKYAPTIQKSIIQTHSSVKEKIEFDVIKGKIVTNSNVQSLIKTKIQNQKSDVVKNKSNVFVPNKAQSKVTINGKPAYATLKKETAKELSNKLVRAIPKPSVTQMKNTFISNIAVDKSNPKIGVDYSTLTETPIYASGDGIVLYSGVNSKGETWVVLQHKALESDYYTIYTGMNSQDLLVKVGDNVKQGDEIAKLKAKSNLHFAVSLSRDSKNPESFFNYINPTFAVDITKSNDYDYKGYISKSPTTEEDYWKLAQMAAKETGWDSLFIFTQWKHETNHFKSNVLHNDNNIAGQTWYPDCGYPKGSPRPTKEGGFYIKFPDPVVGYVDFIKNNPRYHHVKELITPEAQAVEVAKQGWATDKNYKSELINEMKENRQKFGDGVQPPTTNNNNSQEQSNNSPNNSENPNVQNQPTDTNATNLQNQATDTSDVQNQSNAVTNDGNTQLSSINQNNTTNDSSNIVDNLRQSAENSTLSSNSHSEEKTSISNNGEDLNNKIKFPFVMQQLSPSKDKNVVNDMEKFPFIVNQILK